MNWKLPLIASTVLAALGLASCGGLPSRSGGTTIANPTVDEMKRLEAQWGVKPAASGPSAAPAGGAAGFTPAPSAPTAPAIAPLQFESVPPTPPAPAPATAPAIPPSLR